MTKSKIVTAKADKRFLDSSNEPAVEKKAEEPTKTEAPKADANKK